MSDDESYHGNDAVSAGHSPGDHVCEVVSEHSVPHGLLPAGQQQSVKLATS